MKGRILLVDDDQDIIFIMKKGLENSGYLVDGYTDPLEALRQFKVDYYNLALFDMRMPLMNGAELYREVKKADGSLKACFFSAFEPEDENIKSVLRELGERCFIRKPIGVKDLTRFVEKNLA